MPGKNDDVTTKDVWDAVSNGSLGKSSLAASISLQGKFLRTIRLESEITYIGRMPENHIVLNDPKVSRSHARILQENGNFFVEDQESENGIFVNEKKTTKKALVIGDKVRVGSHVLEIVEAQLDDAEGLRESHMEESGEEEWRLDRTVSMTSEQLQKMYAGKRKKAAKKEKSPKPTKPKITLMLEIGGNKYEKEIVFETGQKREESPNNKNQILVRVEFGKWILQKSTPL